MSTSSLRSALLATFGLLAFVLGLSAEAAQAAPCDAPIANEIVCENSKPGNPPSEWDISGAGDASIQGFATDISVDQGETVRFKVDTACDRLPPRHLPDGLLRRRRRAQGRRRSSHRRAFPRISRPASNDAADRPGRLRQLGRVGVLGRAGGRRLRHLLREARARGRDRRRRATSSSSSATTTATRTCSSRPPTRPGRPTTSTAATASTPARRPAGPTRSATTARSPPAARPRRTRLFNAEYPMVRWLERTATTSATSPASTADRYGSEILEHEVFLSVGHDEYWSGGQRANVEAARDAGINLAFFSGNEVFWKTRWENSIDGSGTVHRTLVSYKETHANAKIDPSPEWTGTWRDDACLQPRGRAARERPQRDIFTVNSGTSAIEVPAADGKMRLWRNTPLASLSPGQTATLGQDTLGYEWDEDLDNGSRPAGLIRLSTAIRSGVEKFQDNGSNYAPGTATHHLTLYRAPSGALVFGAGTDPVVVGPRRQPRSRRRDPRRAHAAGDGEPVRRHGRPAGHAAGGPRRRPAPRPTRPRRARQMATHQLPAPTVESGQQTTDQRHRHRRGRTAQVGGVEVSIDGGTTGIRPRGARTGRYTWTPGATGRATIGPARPTTAATSRRPGRGSPSTSSRASCPCSIWSDCFTAPPSEDDTGAVELGVKFRSDDAGVHHRPPLLQEARQHRHPRRPPLDRRRRQPARRGDLHRRDRLRLAGGAASRRPWRSTRTPPTSPPITRRTAATRPPTATSPATASTARPLHALADGDRRGERRLQLRPSGGRLPGPTPSSRATTGSTSSSTTDVGPDTTPPTINSTLPARTAPAGVDTGTNVTATFSEPMDAGDDQRHQRRAPRLLERAGPGHRHLQRRPHGRRPSIRTTRSQNSTTYTATIKGGSGRGQGRAPATRSRPTPPGRSRPPRRRHRRPTRGRAGRSW